MKVLIIDNHLCLATDLALRAIAAGHDVKWYQGVDKRTGNVPLTGRGLVPKVRDWRDHMRWADLVVVTDCIKNIHALEPYRVKGFPIMGPSVATAAWEMDRSKGMEVLQAVGISVPPSEEFRSYRDAREYVINTMGRYVSKPSGDADKALSYCSKGPQDLLYMFDRWEAKGALQGPFILQEFIPGIEMAVGAWFGGGEFSAPCENWEFKKLMNGDLGVATGEQGTIVRYTEKSLLAERVLYPLQELLAYEGYVGYIDVNCIIDEDGTPWPLEFTMRPGYPISDIQRELHQGDPVEWMLDLVNGEHTLKVRTDVTACGVVVAIPDYPYSHLTSKDVAGVPIYGMDEDNQDHIHLAGVMAGRYPDIENGHIVSVDGIVSASDYVLVGAGTGRTVSDAKDAAYRTVKSITIPNSPSYRTDIGDRLKDQLPKLHRMGYAKGLRYD